VIKLRKIVERIWVNKERLVFAIMVLVLCWYVYKAVNPPPPPEEVTARVPRKKIGEGYKGVNVPAPPVPERPGEWNALYERNPFWYYSSISKEQGRERPQDAGITLLNIRTVSGRNRAQLQTESSKKWYDEGESFEKFELLKIDPEAGTCDVYSEQLGKVITLRLPGE